MTLDGFVHVPLPAPFYEGCRVRIPSTAELREKFPEAWSTDDDECHAEEGELASDEIVNGTVVVDVVGVVDEEDDGIREIELRFLEFVS